MMRPREMFPGSVAVPLAPSGVPPDGTGADDAFVGEAERATPEVGAPITNFTALKRRASAEVAGG
jgi:hypothetical protein